MPHEIRGIEVSDPVFYSHISDICASLLCEDIQGYIAIALLYINGVLHKKNHKSHYEGGCGYSSRVFPLSEGYTLQRPFLLDKEGTVIVANYSVSDPLKEEHVHILYSGGKVVLNPSSTSSEVIFALPIKTLLQSVCKTKLK